MRLKYICLIITFLSLIFIEGCSSKKSGNEDSDFFSTVKSLRGIEVDDNDLGIKFYPPKEWMMMQSSLSKKIESRTGIAKADDNFVYQPVYVFFNQTIGGFLSIGKVVTGDSSLTINSRINYYKGLISTKYKDNDLSIGNFTKSGIKFSQFRFKKENLVSLKIIFENTNNEIIQMDYTVPKENLEKSLASIKSSIGSVELLK